MPINLGTRSKALNRHERTDQGTDTRSRNTDHGMSKLVTASVTFGSGQVSGANGTFAAFAVYDPILVQSTAGSLNDGCFFTVTAIDTVNQAYLTLDPPPKAEGPLSVTIRTP
jgi:hypothetical protein